MCDELVNIRTARRLHSVRLDCGLNTHTGSHLSSCFRQPPSTETTKLYATSTITRRTSFLPLIHSSLLPRGDCLERKVIVRAVLSLIGTHNTQSQVSYTTTPYPGTGYLGYCSQQCCGCRLYNCDNRNIDNDGGGSGGAEDTDTPWSAFIISTTDYFAEYFNAAAPLILHSSIHLGQRSLSLRLWPKDLVYRPLRTMQLFERVPH